MSNFAVVLVLSAAVSLSHAETISAYKSAYTSKPPISAQAGGINGGLLFDVGGQTVVVGVANEPLPRKLYEFPLKSIGSWPEAERVFKSQRAYIVVGLLDELQGHRAALAGATATTLLAGALSRELPVTAVIFAESAIVVEPGDLLKQSTRLADGSHIPVDFWVSVVPDTFEIVRGNRAPMVFSLGLEDFVGREIELSSRDYSLDVLVNRVLNMSSYLIGRGPIVKDGETMGMTTKEKIRVRYKNEGVRPGIPIYEMSVEIPDPYMPSD